MGKSIYDFKDEFRSLAKEHNWDVQIPQSDAGPITFTQKRHNDELVVMNSPTNFSTFKIEYQESGERMPKREQRPSTEEHLLEHVEHILRVEPM